MKFLFYNTKTDYMGELPERVTLDNGLTRTDSTTYTDEELQQWGYVAIPSEPEVQVDEYTVFNRETVKWDVYKKPFGPQWEEVRTERNKRLAETDWYVIRFLERGTPIPEEITTYRKALRDITAQENPFFIQWPQIFPDTTSIN